MVIALNLVRVVVVVVVVVVFFFFLLYRLLFLDKHYMTSTYSVDGSDYQR